MEGFLMKRIFGFLILCLVLASSVQAETVNFKLRNLEGKTVELAEICKDGPVLIAFWATFCEPCKKEIPHLLEMRKNFVEEKLQVLLISVDTPRSQRGVKPFVRGKKWDCPVLLDTSGKVMKKLKGKNPPYTLLVNESAEVIYRHSGYRPGDEKALEKELHHLLSSETK
jgi:cytochrome c biogenesis protein CcmG, thiol:disulfide interchange protein DsbE